MKYLTPQESLTRVIAMESQHNASVPEDFELWSDDDAESAADDLCSDLDLQEGMKL
jgi:hypothetical protein